MTKTVFLGLLLVAGSASAAPLFVDDNGRPLYTERTICGDDDLEPMAEQSASMKRLGRPVGFVKIKMAGGSALCTGTLVAKDLFLTAQHCEGACADISVTFGYLERAEEVFACKEIVEKGSTATNGDYQLIRLQGSPGVAWGWYPLSDKPVHEGCPLTLIHHPGGKPMQLSRAECEAVSVENGMLRHRCDTEGGSSGGGILSGNIHRPDTLRVVGVHTLGGCDTSSTSYNSGVALADVIPTSQALPPLVKPVCSR